MTFSRSVGIVSNVHAVELLRERTAFSETAFAELVLWQAPTPVAGSAHEFKYRLAYVVDDICVVRYDSEGRRNQYRSNTQVKSAAFWPPYPAL